MDTEKGTIFFLLFLYSTFGRSCVDFIYPGRDNYSGAVGTARCAGVGFGKTDSSSFINRPESNW